jgi:hypothetical protein
VNSSNREKSSNTRTYPEERSHQEADRFLLMCLDSPAEEKDSTKAELVFHSLQSYMTS